MIGCGHDFQRYRCRMIAAGIVGIAAFLRLVNMPHVPPGVTNDEVGYFYNAYSIAKTGADIYRRPWPLLFHVAGWPFMPVPVYLLSLIYHVVEPGAVSSRLPNIVLGVAGIVVLMAMVQTLFRRRSLSLLSGAVLAVSPWHIHFSRTGYDGSIAVFFYLFGLLIGSWSVARGRSIAWMAFPWVLAIASHRASSVLAVPLLLTFLGFHWRQFFSKRTLFIEMTVIIVITVATELLFVRSYKTLGSARLFTREVSIFDVQTMEKEILGEIQQSDAPVWLARLFTNKATYTLRKLRENYLPVFSPQFLFTSGEADGIYSLWWRGQMYIFELPLILFGFSHLTTVSRASAWYLAFLILVAPLPAAISSGIYSMRAFLLSYLLPVVTAAGILWWHDACRARSLWMGRFAVIVVAVGYSLVVSSYLYQYHFRYPTYGAERWFKAEKDLALFVHAQSSRYEETLIAPAGVDVVLQYAYYTKIDPRIIQEALVRARDDEIRLPGGIRFIRFCAYGNRAVETFLTPTMLYITRDSCQQESDPTEILFAPKSVRVFWKVFRGDREEGRI